jgi:hypothetical protein
MTTLPDMLKKEIEGINRDLKMRKRNDCTDLIISAIFESGHTHHILPKEPIQFNMAENLLLYVTKNINQMSSVISKLFMEHLLRNNKEDKSFDELIDFIDELKSELIKYKENIKD